jgi:hypothetical protein
VRDAVRKGEGRDVTVRVQGRLHELPYNLPGEGRSASPRR